MLTFVGHLTRFSFQYRLKGHTIQNINAYSMLNFEQK